MIPQLGLGTFRIKGQKITDIVEQAIDIGYRHIDTAQFYENEADVGKALANTSIKRDNLFVTTKVWHENLKRQPLIDSLKRSCDHLQVDQVDLGLIHWPSPDNEVRPETYMEALMEAKSQGLTKHIGVSNFPTDLLRKADQIVGPGNILTNQVELHPFMQNDAVQAACKSLNIQVTAYMPLAVGKVMEDDTLKRIAVDHDASAAQVAIAWLLHKGIIAIPSTTKTSHLRSNFEAQQLSLSEDEMVAIDQLNRNERIVDPDFAPQWDN